MVRRNAIACQVLEFYKDYQLLDPSTWRNRKLEPTNCYPAAGLPSDSVLVVRTAELQNLEARTSELERRVDKPLERRERTTLLISHRRVSENGEGRCE